jgi:hypothetical protein
MVRRRCKLIVCVDAGQDKTCSFDDLGNALRKIYIDTGVRVEFREKINIFPREPKRPSAGDYAAFACVRYSDVDREAGETGDKAAKRDGWLLYIKPAFYDDAEPPDILSYAKSCSDFPHEPTGDQFFSESQFES